MRFWIFKINILKRFNKIILADIVIPFIVSILNRQIVCLEKTIYITYG